MPAMQSSVGRGLVVAIAATALALAPLGSEAATDVRPQRAELENGLILLHRPNPAALTAAVCCFIRASALVETRATAGLRNLTQETLLDLPDAQGRRLEESLGELGITMTVQTSPDYVETLFQGTADQLPQLLGAVRVILGNARPDPRQFNARRQAVLRSLQERRELPLPVARDMAQAHLYADTPCAWPPLGNFTVSTLRLEQALALRQMRYVPNRTVVTVAADVSWDTCRALVHTALGNLLPRPVVSEPPLARTRQPRSAYLYQAWNGDNATVTLATPCPGPDRDEFAAAAVLNGVLGAGEGSRLFEMLRQQSGLVYHVETELTPSGLCGMLAISVTCEPKQAAQVFQIMQSEVAGLKNRPPTAAEVQRAKAYLTSSYLLGHQRNSEVAHYLGLFELLSPSRHEAGLVDMLNAVTAEQVANAAGWLRDRSVWVQVGGQRP